MATDFPQFARLPTEVRCMVWRNTIDDKGSFCSYSHSWKHPELLGRLHDINGKRCQTVRLPRPVALWVNREARAVVRKWMADADASLVRPREDGPANVMITRFDPERHYLYVPRDKWRDFDRALMGEVEMGSDTEEEEEEEEEDIAEDWSAEKVSGLKRRVQDAARHLALPAFTAYYSVETLVALAEEMPHLEKVYVIWGELPKDRLIDYWQLYRLEPQGSGEVELHHQDPQDGHLVIEKGDLDEWMNEIQDQLATTEVTDSFAERFVDEAGEVTLEFVPMRLVASLDLGIVGG